MKLKILLDIIDNLKTNSEIKTEIEEEKIIFIEEYIASTIKDSEIALLKKLDNKIEVDTEVLSWVLFNNESDRNRIFNNLNSKTFTNKSVEVIDKFEEIISSNKEINPIETIPLEFYKYVSLYIQNRGINNKQLDYPKRFLKSISKSWKQKSFSDLTPRQSDYLEKLIKDHPKFFNNDYLKEQGFSSECNIIAEVSNEP